MKIKFKKLHPDAIIPKLGTEGASNFDFTVVDIEYIADNKLILKFGLAVEFSKRFKLVIVPRSSFTHKGWIQANSPGQVDSDYRGELQMRIEAIPQEIGIHAISGEPFLVYKICPFKVGDRAAQGHLEEVVPVEFEEVEELKESIRGVGGWGSTGL